MIYNVKTGLYYASQSNDHINHKLMDELKKHMNNPLKMYIQQRMESP